MVSDGDHLLSFHNRRILPVNKPFELDHVFILTQVAGAPAADKLVEFGLVEGLPNIHPGQGTANRRFFFQNVMLEILWVADAKESQASDLSVIWHRSQQPEASPFGVCLRPTSTPSDEKPFPGWRYTPGYLPEPLFIWVGQNSETLSEPFMFYLDFARFQNLATDHVYGLQTVSRLSLVGCDASTSEVLIKTTEHTDGIQFLPGDEPFMELGFNGETQGQSMDFHPHLPLRLCW